MKGLDTLLRGLKTFKNDSFERQKLTIWWKSALAVRGGDINMYLYV